MVRLRRTAKRSRSSVPLRLSSIALGAGGTDLLLQLRHRHRHGIGGLWRPIPDAFPSAEILDLQARRKVERPIYSHVPPDLHLRQETTSIAFVVRLEADRDLTVRLQNTAAPNQGKFDCFICLFLS